MMRKIELIDQTLRDGPQCLWATRMTTASMLSIAPLLDQAGFGSIDIAGQVQFDVCIRFLKENPWERLRILRERIRRTRTRAFMRSEGYSFNSILADDLIELWIERLVANGIDMIVAFDGLNDISNIARLMRMTKRHGGVAVGCITFSMSPVHTNEMYFEFAKGLVKEGAEVVMLKDSGGLLTIDRVRTLIPGIRKAIGGLPFEIHSHCTTGIAPLAYLEAVALGADALHTSTAPLANGTAQPSTQATLRNLRHLGYDVGVDGALIDEVAEHVRQIALNESMPLGIPLEYDATHYTHQLPGGMSGNFRQSLKEAGMPEKMDEVLEECAKVREDLGWPMAITPFSQLIGTQALINVIQGERYRTVPDAVKMYALGYFGRLLAPVKADVMDRIVANGSRSIALEPRRPEPMLPALRRKYSGCSEDEMLLRQMYAGRQVDVMLAAPPIDTTYSSDPPVLALIKGVINQKSFRGISIKAPKVDVQLELNQ